MTLHQSILTALSNAFSDWLIEISNENSLSFLLSSIGLLTFQKIIIHFYLSSLIQNIQMSEKLIHSFEGTCPLTHHGVYGIKKK